MRQTIYLGFAAALILASSTACARLETPVSRFHGTSYSLAGEAQLYNPAAGIKDGIPSGFDGAVAQKIYQRYEKSFETPPAKTDSYSVVVEGMQTRY